MSRLLIGLLLLLAAGCSAPPQKEIDEAQSAIDAARAAGADRYVADEFTAAETTLQKSRAAVDQRDYKQALSYAIDARQRAIAASRQVADARERARQSADALLRETASRADALDLRLKAAAEARVPAKDLKAPRTVLAEARTALQEARTKLDGRNYFEASDALKGVREKLDAAVTQVTSIPPPRNRKTGKQKAGKR